MKVIPLFITLFFFVGKSLAQNHAVELVGKDKKTIIEKMKVTYPDAEYRWENFSDTESIASFYLRKTKILFDFYFKKNGKTCYKSNLIMENLPGDVNLNKAVYDIRAIKISENHWITKDKSKKIKMLEPNELTFSVETTILQ